MTIARFHLRGVHHADLNAHKTLLADDGAVYELDFDRGRIRACGAWENNVLARLHRSLVKISAGHGTAFDERQWLELIQGYAGGSGR